MKYLILAVGFFAGFILSGCSSGSKLISDKKSDYKIFVSAKASKPEWAAAAELRKYLEKIKIGRAHV